MKGLLGSRTAVGLMVALVMLFCMAIEPAEAQQSRRVTYVANNVTTATQMVILWGLGAQHRAYQVDAIRVDIGSASGTRLLDVGVVTVNDATKGSMKSFWSTTWGGAARSTNYDGVAGGHIERIFRDPIAVGPDVALFNAFSTRHVTNRFYLQNDATSYVDVKDGVANAAPVPGDLVMLLGGTGGTTFVIEVELSVSRF